MNKALLQGNVGKEPDIVTLESGKKIAKFSLATRSFKKDQSGNYLSDWHRIICWDKLAEVVEKYVHKGSKLLVVGEIQYGSYTNKDGQTVYTTDINCRELELLDSKGESKSDNSPKNNEGEWKKGEKREVTSTSNVNDLPGNVNQGDVPDDDNLPF